ncbi:MAG: Right origin-binding protein [Chloroflexi bacterium ADurb.Bin360]|nr:MAG: Right origin-binding protein [Chloroflexi bacterium ADurb.Bin360]
MSDPAAIVRALDFIENHLQTAITLGDVADAVAYSLYHFCRSFKNVTHYTPYDYLMRRRIAEAARALLHTSAKVTDVAFDYQFNNLETFSRAFRRVLGQSPSQWRQQGQVGYRQLLPPLTGAHVEHIARCGPWQPAELPDFTLTLVGVMTLGDRDAPAWAWLSRELAGAAVRCESCYAWVCHPRGDELERAVLAAVAAQVMPEIPPGLVRKDLPQATYLRFAQVGTARDLELLRDYIDYVWLPQSDYRVAHPCYLVRYAAIPGLQPSESNLEVYVPVERRQS